ncbi:MAG: hypothetical protein WBE37_12055 [Bryobacteraceae bacterium]
MQLSAEIRLFWFDKKPEALERWFLDQVVHPCAPGGGKQRKDVYLRDASQIELGIKTRGEKPGVEVKGLVATLGDALEFNSCQIAIELWSKWTSLARSFAKPVGCANSTPPGAKPVEIALDSSEQPVGGAPLPEKGCNFEWTIVETSSNETCWTLGFEAFGGWHDIEDSLRSVVHTTQDRNPPKSPNAKAASYPAWLAKRY